MARVGKYFGTFYDFFYEALLLSSLRLQLATFLTLVTSRIEEISAKRFRNCSLKKKKKKKKQCSTVARTSHLSHIILPISSWLYSFENYLRFIYYLLLFLSFIIIFYLFIYYYCYLLFIYITYYLLITTPRPRYFPILSILPEYRQFR